MLAYAGDRRVDLDGHGIGFIYAKQACNPYHFRRLIWIWLFRCILQDFNPQRLKPISKAKILPPAMSNNERANTATLLELHHA